MQLDAKQKQKLKRQLAACLASDQEIRRIVVFGSFLTSSSPTDMDIAIFQESNAPYVSLAMKYRRQARPVSRQIPLDIIPLRTESTADPFLREIAAGEIIYERHSA